MFLKSLKLKRDELSPADLKRHPFNVPALRALETLEFHPRVTFFIGENGTGKSTLLEALAIALDLNPEGGSHQHQFRTHDSHSDLHNALQIRKSPFGAPAEKFFLRAESAYGMSTYLQDSRDYTGLHQKSHGEAFLHILETFKGQGLYLLDEPESALSPQRQLTALSHMDALLRDGSQFIIATHSPIILAYPYARIYHFSEVGIQPIAFEESEHYTITREFLNRPSAFLRHLVSDAPPSVNEWESF